MDFESSSKSWTKSEIDQRVYAEFAARDRSLNKNHRKYFTRVSDLELRPPEWLIEGVLERACLTGLIGSAGCGKSFLAIDMACSIASGKSFHDRAVSAGKVLFIAGEGQRGITARIEAWCKANDVAVNTLDLHISTQPIPMHNDIEVLNVVAEAERLRDVKLIIIDTLARSFGGHNENSTQDMNHFINNCDMLRGDDRGVMVVHHSGHNGDRARGNSAFYAALDAEISLKKSNNDIAVTCTKMKDAPEFDPLNFILVSLDLEVNGHEFQTCYLEEVAQRSRPPRLTAIENLALETLISGTKQNVSQGFLHLEQWRPLFYAGHTGDNDNTKKKAFQRARESIVNKGFATVLDDEYSIRDIET